MSDAWVPRIRSCFDRRNGPAHWLSLAEGRGTDNSCPRSVCMRPAPVASALQWSKEWRAKGKDARTIRPCKAADRRAMHRRRSCLRGLPIGAGSRDAKARAAKASAKAMAEAAVPGLDHRGQTQRRGGTTRIADTVACLVIAPLRARGSLHGNRFEAPRLNSYADSRYPRASALSVSMQQRCELVCRIGGEECGQYSSQHSLVRRLVLAQRAHAGPQRASSNWH